MILVFFFLKNFFHPFIYKIIINLSSRSYYNPFLSKYLLNFIKQNLSIKVFPGPISEAIIFIFPDKKVKFEIPPILTTKIFFFVLEKWLCDKLEQEERPP